MTTTQPKRPETFVVGETVALVFGEYDTPVKVTAVEGDTVTIDYHGLSEAFVARKSDGRHVRPEEMNAVVMPTMIAHFREEAAPRQSFWNRAKSFLK